MEQTTNYGFNKPNGSDYITDDKFWKENWDTADAKFASVDSLLSEIAINIKSYKNFVLNYGKPNEDWAPALKQALTEHNKVYIPRGTYRMGIITFDPTMSGKTIYGDGDETIIVPLNGNLFSIYGTVDNEINITSNLPDFTNSIPVTSASSFTQGDFFLLKGQRDCLNETDSGESWTLGYATPALQGLFFGEYLEVDSVTSNTITTKSYTIFPFYRSDKTQETSVYARNCTTIAKTNFVKDLIFRDFKVVKTYGYVFYFNKALNCKVDNITVIGDGYQNSSYIAHTFFNNSLNCEAKNCRFRINHAISPVNYYDVNVYKCVGSTNCGFVRCYAYNTGQSVDFTYNAKATPTINCYVEGCVFENPTQSGFTSHGGTFQCRWIGNIVRGARQGFSCRTRNSIIANNVFIGHTVATPNTLHYGIGLYEGYAVDCVITGNTIIGFYTGIGVFDATDIGETFKYCGALITNNTIKNFTYGVHIYKNNKKVYVDMGIKIMGNDINASNAVDSTGVLLDKYTKGVTIKDNTITGSLSVTSPLGSGILADYNASNIRAIGNTFRNCNTGLSLRGNNDSTVTGGYVTYDEYMNDYQNVTTPLVIATSCKRIDSIGHKFVKFIEMSTTTDNIYNNSFFIDSADNKLKFKDNSGIVKTVTLT